ncbi:hypothetical protein FMM05_01490 [Flavobacterium zepuense]|uniref:DUF4870 domain-containing protein n=1 Tax=Flavobacterium zepuense TaxID=2593302 RepID=A0A552VAF6_9FLAO|nr:hypothetical protein [Flavobacterium zepuense]TRW27340.1 hypothetical protein FMM05_01490 [Flavobacterium zepuense]
MSEYKTQNTHIYVTELEQASNSYLMAVVSVIAGLPLPIINVIASFFFYLAHRNASYFVRWHCIQSVLSQAVMIPFNSIAFAWTLKIMFNNSQDFLEQDTPNHYTFSGMFASEFFDSLSLYYVLYISIIILLNIVEFFAVITTAAQVRKGKNVRWFLIANITDALTSKQNRDKFRI